MSQQTEPDHRPEAEGKPILGVDSLDVEYVTKKGNVKALRDVSLNVFTGETLGVAGESGSGKSTLALAILQYLGSNGRISNGSIQFRDRSLTDLPDRELRSIRGKEIAHVPQDPKRSLNPSIRVGEQIAETIKLHQDVSKAEARDQTIDVLESVHISEPEYTRTKYPHELSGGMQQRVLIAMALSCNPSLLILDEPTTGLDVTTQANILNLVNDLKEEYDTSILLITHNLGIIAEIADRVSILYAGEIMEKGPVEELFDRPANPYTQGLLATIPEVNREKKLVPIRGRIPSLIDIPDGCIFAERCDFAEPECRQGQIGMESASKNHQVRCRRWQTAVDNPIEAEIGGYEAVQRGEKMFEVDGLKKYFDTETLLDRLRGGSPPVKAVNGVSFDIYESESVALVGESGCGKSTLGRTLLGLYDATDGTIQFRGENIGSFSDDERRRFRSECQIVFQNPDSSLNPRKTTYETLVRPLRLFTDMAEAGYRERIAELLEQVGLDRSYASRYPHELSGGEKQRVAIARAFAANPSFVVLDEPVSSLDVSVQANILNLLSSLREEYNTSYLFISHDLSVVRQICDRVNVMYLGEIVESGPVEAIFEDPGHPYAEALMKSVPRLEIREGREMHTLTGEVPSARDPPDGCSFHTRCPYAREECRDDSPQQLLANSDDPTDRNAACFREVDDHEYWESPELDLADLDTSESSAD